LVCWRRGLSSGLALFLCKSSMAFLSTGIFARGNLDGTTVAQAGGSSEPLTGKACAFMRYIFLPTAAIHCLYEASSLYVAFPCHCT
jgi:hypothetical protein